MGGAGEEVGRQIKWLCAYRSGCNAHRSGEGLHPSGRTDWHSLASAVLDAPPSHRLGEEVHLGLHAEWGGTGEEWKEGLFVVPLHSHSAPNTA